MPTCEVRASPICATSVPSPSASVRYGRRRANASAGSDGKFTAFLMTPSLRKSRTASAVSTPTSSCASPVDAAMCGVAITFGSFASVQSSGGSLVNTSSAAPPTWPDSSAAASAASSISSPRAVLTIRMPFLHFANRSALKIRRVDVGHRQVQREVVGRRADLVEREQPGAVVRGEVGGDERVVGDDGHPEGAGAGGDFLADAAEADHAERLAADLDAGELLLLPLALLHRGVGRGDRARQREDERERELGDADAVGAGRVHDDDAPRAGGGEVDVVDAGAGAGDDPELRGLADQGRRDLRRASHDDGVGVGEGGLELGQRTAGRRVDRPPLDGAQEVGGRRGQIIGDDDFHGGPAGGKMR